MFSELHQMFIPRNNLYNIAAIRQNSIELQIISWCKYVQYTVY